MNYKNNVEGLYYILKNLFKFDIINWVVYIFYELCFRREILMINKIHDEEIRILISDSNPENRKAFLKLLKKNI